MEELQLTLTPSRVDQRNFGLMLSNWRVGQVLNALVVDRMPSGNVLLNVGGREFVTSMDVPVQPGRRLQLEVQQVQPQVTLKLLTDADSAVMSQLSQRGSGGTLLGANAAGSEPKSATPASFLNAVSTQPALRGLINQTPALASLISLVSAQSLQANAITAGAVAAMVARSGIFNEANLAEGRSNRAADSVKTKLAQIQKLIADIPAANIGPEARLSFGGLSELANAALANLNQQQLISMPQDNGQRWAFTLPLALGPDFVDLAMNIERDDGDAKAADDNPSWRVDLRLELPEIGPLRVLLSLLRSEVTVTIQSDSAPVRALVESSWPQLKDRMILSDFRVKSLSTQVMTVDEYSNPDLASGFEVRA